MTKTKTPKQSPVEAAAQPGGPNPGNPTTGGVTPRDASLDPSTGLPFAAPQTSKEADKQQAEVGGVGRPTTGGMTPADETKPAPAAEQTKKVAAAEAKKVSAKKATAKKTAPAKKSRR